MEGYIARKVVKETEKAYLVEVTVANRRDGWHTKFKWVGKSICKDAEYDEAFEKCFGKHVYVPETVIGNAVW